MRLYPGSRTLWWLRRQCSRTVGKTGCWTRQETSFLSSHHTGKGNHPQTDPRRMGTRMENINQRRASPPNRHNAAGHPHPTLIRLLATELGLPPNLATNRTLLAGHLRQTLPISWGYRMRVRYESDYYSYPYRLSSGNTSWESLKIDIINNNLYNNIYLNSEIWFIYKFVEILRCW